MPVDKISVEIHKSLLLLISPLPKILYDMVFSYAKSTFTKTKRCCHITFLKTCLRRNHIPKGMTLQHTPSNHSNKQLKSVTDRILKQSSIKLMRSHITDSDREVQILSRKINCLKHQINTLCEPIVAGNFTMYIELYISSDPNLNVFLESEYVTSRLSLSDKLSI